MTLQIVFLFYLFYIFCFESFMSLPNDDMLSNGMLFSKDPKNYFVYEKNFADPALTMVGISKNENLFLPYFTPMAKKLLIMKSNSCGKNLFPHGMLFNEKNGHPLMLCERHHCLNPKNIICEENVLMEDCNGYFKWVAGFQMDNKKILVECCRYNTITYSSFVKHINFTLNQEYIHEIFIENGKLADFDYLNNVKRIESFGNNNSLYSATVYRMRCSSFYYDFDIETLSQKMDEKIKTINSTEIAKYDSSTMKLYIEVLEKRAIGDYSNSFQRSSIDVPENWLALIGRKISSNLYFIGRTIRTKDFAKYHLGLTRFMAAEIATKSPYGKFYTDMVLPNGN